MTGGLGCSGRDVAAGALFLTLPFLLDILQSCALTFSFEVRIWMVVDLPTKFQHYVPHQTTLSAVDLADIFLTHIWRLRRLLETLPRAVEPLFQVAIGATYVPDQGSPHRQTVSFLLVLPDLPPGTWPNPCVR